MRSRRLAVTAVLLGCSGVAAAGCGSGKDTQAFLGTGGGAPAASAPAPPPAPVVVAGPVDAAVAEGGEAQDDAAGAAAATEARDDRGPAREARSEEREEAERARERAAARKAARRAARTDAAEQREAEQIATPTPTTTSQGDRGGDDAISGSSTGPAPLVAERDRRSAAEARAAIVRMHEMLGNRDVRACDLMTDRLLESTYGSAASARERCRAAVSSLEGAVSVTISEVRAHGRAASVAAVSRVGDSEVAPTFALVLVNGTWLIDAIERRPPA